MIRCAVVDDHPVIRAFTDHAFRDEGLEPVLISSGPDALRELRRGAIDLWFIDSVLPGMTGIELVRAIRGTEGESRSYIFLAAAKCDDEDILAGYEAGVSEFIRKPISAVELRARLGAALRQINTHRDLQQRLLEIQQLNARLQEAASTDELTGLCNRRRGLDTLETEWNQSIVHSTPLTICVVDLDHFKQVNDSHGHAVGDEALREIATTIRINVRESDCVARVGGEEFLIILPNTRLDDAHPIMERIRAAVERVSMHADGVEVPLAISGGLAERTGATRSWDDLLRVGDRALYRAKEAGRNRIELASAA